MIVLGPVDPESDDIFTSLIVFSKECWKLLDLETLNIKAVLCLSRFLVGLLDPQTLRMTVVSCFECFFSEVSWSLEFLDPEMMKMTTVSRFAMLLISKDSWRFLDPRL